LGLAWPQQADELVRVSVIEVPQSFRDALLSQMPRQDVKPASPKRRAPPHIFFIVGVPEIVSLLDKETGGSRSAPHW
jgi:hypothetical protein